TLLGGLLMIAVFAVVRGKQAPASAPVRLSIMLPPGQSLAVITDIQGAALAISPDGAKVVYQGITSKGTHLYLRNLSAAESSLLPGTEGGSAPFFSPDGESLGFFAHGHL